MNYYKKYKRSALSKGAFFVFCNLFLLSIVFPVTGYAERKKQDPVTIYGEVISEQGIPVMGAFIGIQESTVQTTTDDMGLFTLNIPTRKSILVVEAGGFEPYMLTLTGEGRVKIILKFAVEGQSIKDKVNMPWMTTDKRSLTAAVSTTTHEELRKSPTMRLNQALSGRLPGLMVVSGSSSPTGSAGSWRIRGIRTLESGGYNNMAKGGSGTPLVMVDGFEREFTEFDASEIATFSILKDAAGTAIYGTKGANGVILITTKRGQENKRTIDVEFSMGFVTPNNLPTFLPAQEYAMYHNEARKNDGLTPLYNDEDIRKYKDGSAPITHPNVNYYKEFIKPLAHQMKGAISLSGGNRILKYFVSLSYNNQGGLYDRMNESDINMQFRYSRYNARANVDVQVFKRLTASFNLSGRIEDRRYPFSGVSSIFQALSRNPSNAFPLEFIGIDPVLKKEKHMLGGNSLYTNNPLGNLSYRGSYDDLQRYYQFGTTLKHDMDYLTKGLRANFEFNTDGYNGFTTSVAKQYLVWEPLFNPDGSVQNYKSYNTESSLSRVWQGASSTQYFGLNFNFTYNRKFGEHAVDGLLMYKHYRMSPRQANQPDSKNQDMVFRGNYSYKNRYFLEATINYAGSENFYLPNKSRFVFPAVSGSWIISDEPWMKSGFMDMLKLRASWGITGNGNYSYLGADGTQYRFPYRDRWWTSTGHSWGVGRTAVVSLVREGVVPNTAFTIETARMVNIGLDARFFKRKLSFSADVFFEKRDNIYTRGEGSVPLVFGVLESNLPILNNGKVTSRGFEVSLGWEQKLGDFSYWANGYVDYSVNKIINMDEPMKEDLYRIETGGRVRQNFGLIALGLFKNKEDVSSSPAQLFGPYQPGDIKYADLNNDGIVDSNDLTAIGMSNFPNLGFALDLGIKYKNFDLTALFQGTSGRSHYIDNYAMRAFYDNGNISTYALGRYTDEASWANATYPRLTTVANANNWRVSTYWMKNATYVRLKNLEVGYNLPAKVVKKIKMNGLRIYFNAYNVFSLDNMDGMDPEDPDAGIDTYPQQRVFNFGLNLKF